MMKIQQLILQGRNKLVSLVGKGRKMYLYIFLCGLIFSYLAFMSYVKYLRYTHNLRVSELLDEVDTIVWKKYEPDSSSIKSIIGIRKQKTYTGTSKEIILNKIRQSKLVLLDGKFYELPDSGDLLLKYNSPKDINIFSVTSKWLCYNNSNLAFLANRDSILLLLNSLPHHAQVDTVKH